MKEMFSAFCSLSLSQTRVFLEIFYAFMIHWAFMIKSQYTNSSLNGLHRVVFIVLNLSGTCWELGDPACKKKLHTFDLALKQLSHCN